MTKTSKSVTYTVDCPVDSAFPFAVMMLEGSFDVPNGFSSAQMTSFSLITWTYEPLSTMTSLFFVVTISPRCDNILLNVSVRWPEEIFTYLEKNLNFVSCLCKPKTFLRTNSKRLHDFRTAHTTQHWDVFLHNSTQKRVPWITLHNLCLGDIQCFGDYHGIIWHLPFASGPFRMLEHTPGVNFATCFFLMRRILWWMPIFTNITPCWQSHSLIANHVGVFSMPKVSFLTKVLFPRLDLGFCSARNALFKLSFTRREMLLTNFSSRYKTSISFNLM